MTEEININGKIYVPKEELTAMKLAPPVKGLKYVIVRTYSAGVFAGFLKSRKGQEVVMVNARRLWYWRGASSLSQIALHGVNKPAECKFAEAVPRVELLQAIEILDVTAEAKKNIESVPIWNL